MRPSVSNFIQNFEANSISAMTILRVDLKIQFRNVKPTSLVGSETRVQNRRIMFKRCVIGVLFIFILSACTNSHEENVAVTKEKVDEHTDVKHSIDTFLDNCLADTMNFTTMGMTQCAVKASEQWGEALHGLVKQLNEILPETIRGEFDASQRNWETYFNAQIEFSNTLFSQSNGTMYSTIRVHNNMTVLRERVLLLEAFLKEAEMLSEFGEYNKN